MNTDNFSAGDLQFYLSNGTAVHNDCSGGCNLSANQWHHIALTYSASADAIIWYVDGVQVADNGTNETINIVATAYDLTLGEAVVDEECDCMLDELRIYNRVLTAPEVLKLYQAGSSLKKPPNNLGLVGYWPFSEGTGGKTTDHSGIGNT